MTSLSLPTEVGQSISYATSGGAANGTATIARMFANQVLGSHYALEIDDALGNTLYSCFPCSEQQALQDAPAAMAAA